MVPRGRYNINLYSTEISLQSVLQSQGEFLNIFVFRNKHEAVVTELKNTQIQCNDLKKQGTNREKEIKKLQKELEVGIIHNFQIN